MKSKSTTLFLAITSIFIALTYLFTAFVNIRLPIGGNGGLIHLGNIPLFIAAILFGSIVGGLAGGVGMGLFDLLSGWTSWAPFTFVISFLMGFTVGKISNGGQSKLRNVLACFIACIIKIAGYYLTEALLFGNWVVPAASIPGNILQVSFAALLVIPAIPVLRKAALPLLTNLQAD